MRPILGPADSLARARGRGRLLAALESESLLTNVKVDSEGHLVLETKDWGEYWKPLQAIKLSGLTELLSALRSSWSTYIRSTFHTDFRREFCTSYFRLLNRIVSHREAIGAYETWTHALQSILGFECFLVTSADADGKGRSRWYDDDSQPLLPSLQTEDAQCPGRPPSSFR